VTDKRIERALAMVDPVFLERAGKAVAERDWEMFFYNFGSHEYWPVFDALQAAFTDEEYWPVLRQVYVGAKSFVHPKWLVVNRQHRELLMTDEEITALAGFPETVDVYRGGAGRGCSRGFSWSLDRGTAEGFAYRMARLRGMQFGTVFKAAAPRASVIAYLREREEEEILINPAHLKIIIPVRRIRTAQEPKSNPDG
jgi:hypothetical protein